MAADVQTSAWLVAASLPPIVYLAGNGYGIGLVDHQELSLFHWLHGMSDFKPLAWLSANTKLPEVSFA